MSLQDNLRRLFSRNVIIKSLPGGRLKAFDVNKSQSVGSPTKYDNRAKWRMGRSYNPVSGYGSSYNNAEIEAVRKQFYMDYELMDTDAIISAALNVIADNCTTISEFGELLVIKSDNAEIKKILHNLFYDVLNVEFNLWSWIRTMAKYGDHFLLLTIVEDYGVVNVQPIHPSLMIREEGSPDNPSLVKFKFEGDYFTNSGRNYFEEYEIAHFRLLADTNFLPYGRAAIDSAKKAYKAMSLAEDAMLLYRIMRSPERRIFKIDVGNIAPEEIDAYIEQVASEMKKTPFIDPQTGDYNLKFNLMSMQEDIFMPVRGGQSGTEISTLEGLQNAGALEDVQYLKDKMMAALGIPKSYLGYGDGAENGKANLSTLDIVFARSIERIQKIFVSELYKVAFIHLKAQGFENEDLMEFTLELTNPSLVFERQKTDVMTAKVDLAKSIREDNILPDSYIYEHIFGLTEDEWKMNRDRLVEDAEFRFRLKQITEEGNDPEKTGKSFGTPWDIATLQVASKFSPGENDKSLSHLYTKDEREENKGKPDQYKGSFETKRDQDFGRDPNGRRENNKMEIPKESFSRFIKKLPNFKKVESKLLNENKINMLDESLLIDESAD